MKSVLNYFLVFLFLNLTGLSATAQESLIPATAWEQHPEGVALALMLTNGTGVDSQSIYLILYVKNTSNNIEYLVTQRHGVAALFFYVDGNSKQVILGDHDHPNHPEKNIIEHNQRLKMILPGKIRSIGTDVTAAEIAVLKTQTVKCRILLNDPTTKQDVAIVGSPQLITTIP